MANIQEILGLRPVETWKTNKAVERESACPSLVMGVELEIENVPNFEELVVPGMYTERDGSLRNDGMEFITRPMTYSFLAYTLEKFFKKAQLGDRNYSERTSVHVHANCQDLTLEQLTSLVLLYQVFEKLLYRFIGEDRDKNIFCVPLCETNITFQNFGNLARNTEINSNVLGLRKWMKYTGLNLLPLFDKGTVEFRHMGGTCNSARILNWCNLIGRMFVFAKENTFPAIKEMITDLNTNSQYEYLLHRVFAQWADLLMPWNFIVDLEEGVLSVKYLFLSPKKAENPAGWGYAQIIENQDPPPAPEEFNQAILQARVQLQQARDQADEDVRRILRMRRPVRT